MKLSDTVAKWLSSVKVKCLSFTDNAVKYHENCVYLLTQIWMGKDMGIGRALCGGEQQPKLMDSD